MRVLVLGATGYVGLRLLPRLLDDGHEVVAASSSAPDPERFGWDNRVRARRCDVTDLEGLRAVLTDIDAVVYLVHSLDRRDFAARDRRGARNLAAALADRPEVPVVYLSGLVPEAPEDELSSHISSRLEVERILAQVPGRSVALRAGVIIGAGSTSFEIIRQIATLFLVHPVPTWMHHRVQPIAVSDVVDAIAEALVDESLHGALDIGGPDVIDYPQLLGLVARASGLRRISVPVLVAPSAAVGVATALATTVPFNTATALIASLHHDMVCREDLRWEPSAGDTLATLEEAIRLACDPDTTGPEASHPADAAWTRRSGLLNALPVPAYLREAARLTWHRLPLPR